MVTAAVASGDDKARVLEARLLEPERNLQVTSKKSRVVSEVILRIVPEPGAGLSGIAEVHVELPSGTSSACRVVRQPGPHKAIYATRGTHLNTFRDFIAMPAPEGDESQQKSPN